jgi:hypothetical protein
MTGIFEMDYFLLMLLINFVCCAPDEPLANQENIPLTLILPAEPQDQLNNNNPLIPAPLPAPLPAAVLGRRFFPVAPIAE